VAERLRVTFDIEVEPTVEASAMEVVTAVLLNGLSAEGLFPDRWSVERG
jgi:hypothetical protein